MKKVATRILLAFFILACVSVALRDNGANYVYAEANESGTVTVIKSNGQVHKDYSNVRDAWDYCRKNSGCTIKLKTDLSTNKEFKVSRKMDVTIDMNGHKMNGNRKHGFEVVAGGRLKITSSAKNTDGSIIKGQIENCSATYGGAIRSRGNLELDNIRFYNCEAEGSMMSDGGAIAIWSYSYIFIRPTDPHALIKNCEIDKCSASLGGGISVKYDSFMPPSPIKASSNEGQSTTCTIQHSSITNCKSNEGGGLYCNMSVALDYCEMKHCESYNDGGGISVPKKGKVYLYHTDILQCEAKKNGGGIAMSDYDGDNRSVVEIYSGSVKSNKAFGKYGGGIDFRNNARLKLGGDVIINDNFIKNKPNNVDMYYKDPLKFYEDGLTDGANVHITLNKDEETFIGKLSSDETAVATALHIDVDEMGGNTSDDFDAYTGNGKIACLFAGRMNKSITINKFEVGGHPEAKVEIYNGEFDFSRYVFAQFNLGDGGYQQSWKAWWHGPGTIKSKELDYPTDHNPLESITTIASGAASQEDKITIKRRKMEGTWTLVFKDNPKYTVASVKSTTAGLSGKTETKYYKNAKVTLTADQECSGEKFVGWEVYGVSLTDEEKSNRTISFKMPENGVAAVALYVTPAEKPACLITLNGESCNPIVTTKGSVIAHYYAEELVRVHGINPGGEGSKDYEFDHWEVLSAPEGFELGDTQRKRQTFEVKMPENLNSQEIVLMAIYAPKYTLYAYKDGVTSGKETMHREGDSITLTAEASSGGNSFQYWEVEGADLPLSVRNKQTLEFKMPANNVIAYAVYQSPVAKPTCLITLNGTNKNAEKGQEPETADEVNHYSEDSKASIKAENPGGTENPEDYRFDHWEVLAAPSGFALTAAEKKSTSFDKALPDSSHLVLEADYLKRYDANAINGTINGKSGTSRIFEGDKIRVRADFMTSKHFLFWIADGVELTEEQMESESFEVTMPAGDVKFVPVYEEGLIYPHNLKIVNGKIVKYGTESSFFQSSLLNIEADTRRGYTFKQWEAEGIELEEDQITSPKISIYMPDNDVTLTATYTKNPGTGDKNNLMLYIGLLDLMLMAIAGWLFVRVKRQSK